MQDRVMRQQRPGDRRFLLPVLVALLLKTSLSDAVFTNAISSAANHSWLRVNADQDGPSIKQRVFTGVKRDRSAITQDVPSYHGSLRLLGKPRYPGSVYQDGPSTNHFAHL